MSDLTERLMRWIVWLKDVDDATAPDLNPDASLALLLSEASERIEALERALEPFAKIAGPIKGEEGRPSYLDVITEFGETEELAVTTIFDTGGRGAVLWADDFRAAHQALLSKDKTDG